jgi:hypothetical protein
MREKGWLQLTDTEDARRKQIELTPAALKHFDKLADAFAKAAKVPDFPTTVGVTGQVRQSDLSSYASAVRRSFAGRLRSPSGCCVPATPLSPLH